MSPDKTHLLQRIDGYTLVMRCGEKRRAPAGIRYVSRAVNFNAVPCDEQCPGCKVQP